MNKIVIICALFSCSVFSQNSIYQEETFRIDSIVNSIDLNQEQFGYMIQEGSILYKDNRKSGGWSSFTTTNNVNEIVKIEEFIATNLYTVYEFYYSNDELILLSYKEEKHKKKKVELLEDCSVYIFENELIYVPINQTKYCSLNYKNLIEHSEKMLQEQYEQIKE